MLDQCVMGITDRKLCATCSSEDCSYWGSKNMKVVMPYIGKALSVNYYHVRIGSRLTTKIRPDVKLWMNELTEKVKGFEHNGSLTVNVFGKFIDGRVPDMDNLAKVILDAIKVGVRLDDRNIKYVSLGYDTGYSKPVLEITLTTE